MANLEESFLVDLEDRADNDHENSDEDTDDAEHMEENVNGDLADMEALNYDDLDSVSQLEKSQRYADIMKKIKDALEKGLDMSNQSMVLENDPEYQLIVECNTLSVEIENEIVIIHNFIRDKYRLKFPELDSIVHHPIDYARVVKKIGNEVNLTIVDLLGLLPSAIILAICARASTIGGNPLPEDVFKKTIEACDRAVTLDASRKKVLDFVESRMFYIAPNLSAIVGSAVAAKLMGTAGGLSKLAKMPACTFQLLGVKKKALAGFSTAKSQFQFGVIEQTEVFQTTPPALKMRAYHLLAGKLALAARVDYFRADPSGSQGRTFLDDIRKKIEEAKKKRGGRRLGKRKERYAITDMPKLANRMQFGIPKESSLRDGPGEGFGNAWTGWKQDVACMSLAAKVAKGSGTQST